MWGAIGTIGAAIVTVIGGLLLYALKKQNENQQRQIDGNGARLGEYSAAMNEIAKDLYGKHTADVDRLQSLELKVAAQMLSRDDMKDILREFKADLNERFDRIEKKMDAQK